MVPIGFAVWRRYLDTHPLLSQNATSTWLMSCGVPVLTSSKKSDVCAFADGRATRDARAIATTVRFSTLFPPRLCHHTPSFLLRHEVAANADRWPCCSFLCSRSGDLACRLGPASLRSRSSGRNGAAADSMTLRAALAPLAASPSQALPLRLPPG